MYRVRGKSYRRHFDASMAARAASKVFPVRLVADNGGKAWYWLGHYCGQRFVDVLRKGVR